MDGVVDVVIDCGGRADGDRIQKDSGDPVDLQSCPGVTASEAAQEFVVN